MKTLNKSINNPKCLINSVKKFFSLDLTLPVVNVDKYLNKSEGWQKECKLVADCLHDTGVLCIRDPVSLISIIINTTIY